MSNSILLFFFFHCRSCYHHQRRRRRRHRRAASAIAICASSITAPFVIRRAQMFDNIAALQFQKGPNNEPLATAMVSAEGEVMEFRTNVAAEGRVEDWTVAGTACGSLQNRISLPRFSPVQARTSGASFGETNRYSAL